MKDISIYFTPLTNETIFAEETIGRTIFIHDQNGFPELDKKGIAIMYVPEFRNGNPELQGSSDDRFRISFYNSFLGSNWDFQLYDLGNVLPGGRVEDTYFAIRQIVAELVKNNIIPIVIGGTQDLTFAMYQGYEELEQMINVMSVDYKLDLGDPEELVSSDAFVSKLLMHRPCFLFNYTVLGYQAPYVKKSELDLFEKLYFDAIRLGEFNADFRVSEPHLRNSDLLTIDLKSIRNSDFKGDYYTNPNGFFNQEMCQIARYAGISDKLTAFGIFNLLPGNIEESAHHQVAQLIWYFIDGVSQRFGDFPVGSKKEYTKFNVLMPEVEHEIIFYKSNKSDRWWMEVPYPSSKGTQYERHHLVPCTKSDYDNALQNDIPNLWWKTYQKLG